MSMDLDKSEMKESLVKPSILSEGYLKKLHLLRTNTYGINFLKVLRQNDSIKASEMLDSVFLLKNNSNAKLSGDAIKSVLEQENDSLATALKSRGFAAPAVMLVDAILGHNEILSKGLIKYQFYSEGCLEAYFWCLLHENYVETASYLVLLDERLVSYNISGESNVEHTLQSESLQKCALEQALRNKFDDLAENIILYNPRLLTEELIELAFEKECMRFIKAIATGSPLTPKLIRNTTFAADLKDTMNSPENLRLKEVLSIPRILERYIALNQFDVLRNILQWPEIIKVTNLLEVLITQDLPEIASEAIISYKVSRSARDFFLAFEKEHYRLCVIMLAKGVDRISLTPMHFQEKLLKILVKPEICLEAVELMSRIPTKFWRSSLTKQLCEGVQIMIKKSEDILFCTQPILFCVLAAEFLKRISNQDYQSKAKCLKVVDLLLDLAKQILQKIKGEDALSYYVMTKDSRSRTTLSIIAKNNFDLLLENDEIGGIIEKLWDRSLNAYSCWDASSVYTSYLYDSSAPEAMGFANKMNVNRQYVFQYSQWTESPKNRFMYAQGVSCVLLIILHLTLIYNAIELDNFWNLTETPATNVEFKFFQTWIFGILAEQILHSMFAWKSKRKNLINIWKLLDLLLFLMMILVSIQESRGLGDTINYMKSSEKVFLVHLFHSILEVMLWVKFASVMLVSWWFGPFIRIIYYMIVETVSFFIILIALFVVGAGVFTAVFNDSDKFATYDVSLVTVFSDAMASFDLTTFNSYLAIGAISESLYLMISNVILINLLIAIITTVYDSLSKMVKRQHRGVLIQYTDKYNWDDTYGVFIFLPSPISSLVLILSPFLLFSKHPKKRNEMMCRIAYIGYAVPQFFVFLFGSLIYAVPLYFKGFKIYSVRRKAMVSSREYIDTVSNERGETGSSKTETIKRAAVWMLIGLPWIFWAVLRDSYHFWTIIYERPEGEEDIDEENHFENIISSEFVDTLQKTLKCIVVDEVTLDDFFNSWKLFDSVANPNPSIERLMQVQEFFKKFRLSTKEDMIYVPYMRRIIPKQKGGFYDESFINRLKYMDSGAVLSGIKKFHANIGALNIAGVILPKPEIRGEFDMDRVNNLNSSIKELQDYYSRLIAYASKINQKLQEEVE